MSVDRARRATPCGLRGAHVMVADDDADFREVVVALLTPLGVRVSEAVDGQDVLERVDAVRPDVLLLDQRLPGLLGTEVAQRLRARQLAVGVVLLTGSPDADELARSAGIEHLLEKPFEESELHAVIAQALTTSGH